MPSPVLDLRSNTECADPGTLTPPPKGVFYDGGHLWLGAWRWYTPLDNSPYWGAPALIDPLLYVDLGDDPLARMNATIRDAMADALEIERASLPDSNLVDILAHYVMAGLADPTGANRVKPLRMGRGGLELHLGSFGTALKERLSTNHPNYDATLAVRRADYDRQAKAGRPLDVLEKWTGYDMQKLLGKIDRNKLADFIGQTYVDEGHDVREPSTTITETWNYPDSDSPDGDLNWTEIDSDWDIVSNQLETTFTDSDGDIRAESDLPADDMLVKVTVKLEAGGRGEGGPSSRYDPDSTDEASNTFYWTDIRENNDDVRLFKKVNGSATELQTNAFTIGASHVVEIESDGSSHRVIIDDTEEISPQTDSAITGYTRTGLHAYVGSGASGGEAAFDDFEASDLAINDELIAPASRLAYARP